MILGYLEETFENDGISPILAIKFFKSKKNFWLKVNIGVRVYTIELLYFESKKSTTKIIR
jgi:hypothetical protein